MVAFKQVVFHFILFNFSCLCGLSWGNKFYSMLDVDGKSACSKRWLGGGAPVTRSP